MRFPEILCCMGPQRVCVCLSVSMRVCDFVHMSLCLSVCLCLSVSVHECVCFCICLCVCIDLGSKFRLGSVWALTAEIHTTTLALLPLHRVAHSSCDSVYSSGKWGSSESLPHGVAARIY